MKKIIALSLLLIALTIAFLAYVNYASKGSQRSDFYGGASDGVDTLVHSEHYPSTSKNRRIAVAGSEITAANSLQDYFDKSKTFQKKEDFLRIMELSIQLHKEGDELRRIVARCFDDLSVKMSPEELLALSESLPSYELRSGILNNCIHPYRRNGVNLDNLIKLSYLIPYENNRNCANYNQFLMSYHLLRELSLERFKKELNTARHGEQREGMITGLSTALDHGLLNNVSDLDLFVKEIENLPLTKAEREKVDIFMTMEDRIQKALQERKKE